MSGIDQKTVDQEGGRESQKISLSVADLKE